MPPQGYPGGRFKPLSERDVQRIHAAALQVLDTVGMGFIGNMPPGAARVIERGGRLTDAGRLCIPPALVEEAIAKARRSWTLHGLNDERSIEITAKGVNCGTAGGAVEILDLETGAYRLPNLADLYDVVRLIDTLPNIRWCYRPLIARDMVSVRDLDINTAYALVTGTTKPWGITIGAPENVPEVVALLDMVLGGEGRFSRAPCCHMIQGAGVPPLRFAEDRCLILEEALRHGMPVVIASTPQAGATAPAALAGTLVQVIAEVLAGLTYVHVLAPSHPVTIAAWPVLVDLRTGAMSGGCAEVALMMAGAAQMAIFYEIPCSVAAAMTDSKITDAQSGFEKAFTVGLAGLAGANMIHESAGMLASLIGCSLESFVIDNEMLGNLARILRGIEVTDDTLSVDVIRSVNTEGPHHYLAHQQTLDMMWSEFHYGPLSDRLSPGEWRERGATDIVQRARTYVRETLSTHFPRHVSPALDEAIRSRFDIKLPRERMAPPIGSPDNNG